MRRANIPSKVVSIGPDTIETAFPTRGVLSKENLSKTKVEIWELSAMMHRYQSGCGGPDVRGCILFPLPRSVMPFQETLMQRVGPVDCNGVGGSIMVPVCHPVPTDHGDGPPIPIINDRPVYGAACNRLSPVLVYPAFRFDPQGRLAVRWDQKLHALPMGRYEARITIDGEVCGVFELDKDYECPLDISSAASIDLIEPAEPLPRPEGISDMFDEIYTWASTTTCQLEAGDTQVGVTDASQLCAATLCRQPQLVITDGVTREIVIFNGCGADNTILITRSGTSPIQAGAVIRFEWTPDNTQAACEGC